MDFDGSSPYELFYPVVKQGHQVYLSNGSLAALDLVLAFDIQRPMGDFKEWHMVTFNQIRILEELNKIKKSLHIRESQSPYEFLYPIVKEAHQVYLSNGSLAALDQVLAFDIQRAMGDWKEWRIVTFNQIRILEELNEIKKVLHVIFISGNNLTTSQPQSPYELFYQIVKQGHQVYLSNGSLAALDQAFAFDIQRPMGDFKELHMVTFNQIRVIEEFNGIIKTLHIIISGGDVTTSQPQTPYELLYQIVKQSHQVYLNNGSLAALDQVFAFDIQRPMGDWKEWHLITFNQIRFLEKANEIKKILPVFRAVLVELIEIKKRVPRVTVVEENLDE